MPAVVDSWENQRGVSNVLTYFEYFFGGQYKLGGWEVLEGRGEPSPFNKSSTEWQSYHQKTWIGTLTVKKILLVWDFVPQTPYQVSVLCKKNISPYAKKYFPYFNNLIWILHQCEHALEQSCLFKMFAPNMHQKCLNHDFISQRSFSFWEPDFSEI